MLIPSRKIFYAVEAVLFIAYNSRGNPISSAEIAEQQQLPARYLEPIMQRLVRAGILRGVRGPAGGYVLGRERRRISLKDICDVISDEKALPASLMPLGQQVLHPHIETLVVEWEQSLASVSIAQLCDQATVKQITTTQHAITDFAI